MTDDAMSSVPTQKATYSHSNQGEEIYYVVAIAISPCLPWSFSPLNELPRDPGQDTYPFVFQPRLLVVSHQPVAPELPGRWRLFS